MQLSKGTEVEIEIADMAFGGAGVGRYKITDGSEMVVFVENAAPGDLARVSFSKIKKNYAEARLVEILKPSPSRIQPRCRHFGTCGGCALQFMSYADQLRWKEKMVADSLSRLGGFEKLPIEPIIGCSDPWFYRNKMEYSFGDGAVGLHAKKSYWRVFDLEECFLSSPTSVEILAWVRAWVKEKKLSAHDSQKGTGLLKTLTIREGKNTGEFLVNIGVTDREILKDAPMSHRGSNGLAEPPRRDIGAASSPELEPRLGIWEKDFTRELCKKFPAVTSVYHTAVIVRRGFKTVMEESLLSGKPTLKETLTVKPFTHTLSFEILPQAFFQPNTLQAQILYGKVLEYGLAGNPSRVLDLFCGTGTIGMFFAKAGCAVTGIDMNESAIEVARQNAETNSLHTIDFKCGDVFKFLSAGNALSSSSLIITDPPRAGIDPKTLEKIVALKIPQWVYVSCNPTTLARDLRVACEAGYRIEKVQPVDMFPQTYHVETVCKLALSA